jgi:broad specificity phosphatase PhoE
MRGPVFGETIGKMPDSVVFVSSFAPEAARKAVLNSGLHIDLVVISPSARARETAVFAVGGRWVFMLEEPLLASRAAAEDGDDVLGRLAQAIRTIDAHDARAILVVVDGLDLIGATAFTVDEAGLVRAAEDLERLLPQP